MSRSLPRASISEEVDSCLVSHGAFQGLNDGYQGCKRGEQGGGEDEESKGMARLVMESASKCTEWSLHFPVPDKILSFAQFVGYIANTITSTFPQGSWSGRMWFSTFFIFFILFFQATLRCWDGEKQIRRASWWWADHLSYSLDLWIKVCFYIYYSLNEFNMIFFGISNNWSQAYHVESLRSWD